MFNITKFEIKHNLISLLTWTIALCVVGTIYISMFSVIENSFEDFKNILESYPNAVLDIIGMDLNHMTTFSGYYSFVLTFINIISFAFAASITLKIFIKEYKNKSVEFISTKPITRKNIVLQKTLAIIVVLTIAIILYTNIMYILVLSVSDLSYLKFVELNLSTYLIMLYAMVVAFLVSTIFRKLRNSGSSAFIIAFGFYFIYIIGTLVESNELIYMSIYGLFEYPALNYLAILTASAIIITIYIVAIVINNRKDVL